MSLGVVVCLSIQEGGIRALSTIVTSGIEIL